MALCVVCVSIRYLLDNRYIKVLKDWEQLLKEREELLDKRDTERYQVYKETFSKKELTIDDVRILRKTHGYEPRKYTPQDILDMINKKDENTDN